MWFVVAMGGPAEAATMVAVGASAAGRAMGRRLDERRGQQKLGATRSRRGGKRLEAMRGDDVETGDDEFTSHHVDVDFDVGDGLE